MRIWKKLKISKCREKSLDNTNSKKKGDVTECNEHRSKSLLDGTYKVLEILLKVTLEALTEYPLGEYPVGFGKAKKTSDQIYITKSAMNLRS